MIISKPHPPTNVIVQFREMEAQKVGGKSEDEGENEVREGDEQSRELVVDDDQVFPGENVKVFQDLTKRKLAHAADEQESSDEKNDVTTC